MDELRRQAREALIHDAWNRPVSLPVSVQAGASSLCQLWQDVSTHDSSIHLNVCENLYFATSFLDGWDPVLPNDQGPRPLDESEVQALNNLFHWASHLALPSSEYAVLFDGSSDVPAETQEAQDATRLRANLAVKFILTMSAKAAVALGHRSVGSSPEIITAMAIFTSEKEPWSTKDTAMNASAFLDVTCQHQRGLVLERLLKEQIRPLFSKSKNPAITSEGRKNLHPVPLPRFDGSILDDSIKPWKNTNVYATSLLRWIVSQYATEAQQHLEAHFPLLVPAILALIDDSSIHFKIQGCEILGQLLESIQRSDSDILIRTNLISVFEDAITPCLLSLPSITPEENSLSLLGVAYPTLLSLFKAAYQTPHFTKSSSPKGKKDEEYTTRLVKVLRSNLVSSFHHVSSSTPASISTAASFPHPRLSAFLLDWIGIFVKELGIHTTKYLQDLVPVLYTTLTNPFGTVHPPLLFAAVSATKAVITNAHPRVWRWRGEILGGLTACWLHIVEEKKGDSAKKDQHAPSVNDLTALLRELQQTMSVLKLALQNPQPVSGGRIDPDQLAAKGGLMEELQQLANADPELEGLLFPERQPRV